MSKGKRLTSKVSDLESIFAFYWQTMGAPITPQTEYKFSQERYLDKRGRSRTRQWRFDFAWVNERVAVEIEGGVFTGGRHGVGMGMVNDCNKYNSAALDGWIVLRYTVKHLQSNPDAVIQQVKQALVNRSSASKTNTALKQLDLFQDTGA